MKHPAEETLRRFARGEGSPAENREVVAHLLRGCKICSEIVREAIQPETPPVPKRTLMHGAGKLGLASNLDQIPQAQ